VWHAVDCLRHFNNELKEREMKTRARIVTKGDTVELRLGHSVRRFYAARYGGFVIEDCNGWQCYVGRGLLRLPSVPLVSGTCEPLEAIIRQEYKRARREDTPCVYW